MQKINPTIQLYGLHIKNSIDLENNFRKLEKRNIQHIELYDSYGIDLSIWKKLIEKYHINILSAHVSLNSLNNKSIHFLEEVGCHQIVIPSIVEEWNFTAPLSYIQKLPKFGHSLAKKINQLMPYRYISRQNNFSKEDFFEVNFWKDAAVHLNSLQEKLSNFKIGIHNHGLEFKQVKEMKTPWEILDENLSKNIFYQLDIGNAALSNNDPVSILHQYRQRVKSIHYKIPNSTRNNFLKNENCQKIISEFLIEMNNHQVICEISSEEKDPFAEIDKLTREVDLFSS